MKYLLNAAIAIATVIVFVNIPAQWFAVQTYVPSEQNLGNIGVTTISTATNLAAFPAIYNTDIPALDRGKIDVGTTSVASITTLGGLTTASALATVGTITSGTWSGTTIVVAKGGTGSTTPSGLLWGDASGTYTSVANGSAGQLLTSNGTSKPSYTSTSVDTAIFYNWTNEHKFTYGMFATLASSTNATTTGSQYFTGIGSAGLVGLDTNNKLYSAATTTAVVPQTKLSGAKPTTSSTGDVSLYTAVVPAGTLNVSSLLRITATFNNSGSANAIVPTIKIGDGTSSTTVASGGTVAFFGQFNILLSNMNSLSSQRGGYQFFQDGSLSGGANIGSPTALTYNTANNLYINAICHVVNASDTCILTDLVIEHIKP